MYSINWSLEKLINWAVAPTEQAMSHAEINASEKMRKINFASTRAAPETLKSTKICQSQNVILAYNSCFAFKTLSRHALAPDLLDVRHQCDCLS